MVPKEREPALSPLRPTAVLPHVARHRALGDPEPQLQQLSVDPWSTPPVLTRHPPDKISELPADRRPARRLPALGEPRPVQREARTVPPDHGLGLHDDDRIGPSRPQPAQHDPERPVRRPDQRPALLQDGGELLTEGGSRARGPGASGAPRRLQRRSPRRVEAWRSATLRPPRRTVNNSRWNGVVARHRFVVSWWRTRVCPRSS